MAAFLKSSPRLSYSGLTIVMSNPSRFDKADLLTANAGHFFNELCLRPDYNRYQCEIRVADDKEPLLPNTKCVLLLGEKAMNSWLGELARGNSLNEMRGSIILVDGIPHIPSYFPQDCVDRHDWEGEHNPLSERFVDNDNFESDDDEDDSANDKRRHGRTKRKNFGFWLRADTNKAKDILQHGYHPEPEPRYIIYPALEEVYEKLTTTKDSKNKKSNFFISHPPTARDDE